LAAADVGEHNVRVVRAELFGIVEAAREAAIADASRLKNTDRPRCASTTSPQDSAPARRYPRLRRKNRRDLDPPAARPALHSVTNGVLGQRVDRHRRHDRAGRLRGHVQID
jgi:hypothetical protein